MVCGALNLIISPDILPSIPVLHLIQLLPGLIVLLGLETSTCCLDDCSGLLANPIVPHQMADSICLRNRQVPECCLALFLFVHDRWCDERMEQSGLYKEPHQRSRLHHFVEPGGHII